LRLGGAGPSVLGPVFVWHPTNDGTCNNFRVFRSLRFAQLLRDQQLASSRLHAQVLKCCILLHRVASRDSDYAGNAKRDPRPCRLLDHEVATMILARLLICLLLSIAAGAAVYLGGAVVWSLIDPDGAGVPLLFTIPLALIAAAVPGLLGTLGMINTNAWRQADARPLRSAGEKIQPRTAPPAKPSRPIAARTLPSKPRPAARKPAPAVMAGAGVEDHDLGDFSPIT
jgi:hypothetical protein